MSTLHAFRMLLEREDEIGFLLSLLLVVAAFVLSIGLAALAYDGYCFLVKTYHRIRRAPALPLPEKFKALNRWHGEGGAF